MGLPFAKYEGLGNDFVVVRGRGAVSSAQAIALCDRHLGVGADGVLMIGLEGGRAFMDVLNADGTVAQMCGNGLRCVALELARGGEVSGPDFDVTVRGSVHRCYVAGAEVTVTMAVPTLDPSGVPTAAAHPLIDAPLVVAGHAVHLTAVSLGNPHAVLFDPVGDARLTLGPAIGALPLFPEGVNVGFARLHTTAAGTTIELDVHERGVGWTRACGTGACAAAVAAVETGRVARGAAVSVRLPGGTLRVEIGALTDPVRMTGPARHVFDGEVDLAALA